MKEKMELDIQVNKLKWMKANHTSQIYRLETDILKNYPMQMTALEKQMTGLWEDAAVAK